MFPELKITLYVILPELNIEEDTKYKMKKKLTEKSFWLGWWSIERGKIKLILIQYTVFLPKLIIEGAMKYKMEKIHYDNFSDCGDR